MAPTSKSRAKRRKCCFFPGGCCFGSFPSEHESNTEKKMLKVDEGKLVKFGSGKKLSSWWGKTVPVSDSTPKKVSNSSREISMVVETEDHTPPLPENKIVANKDILLEKSKHVKNSGRVSISPVKQPEKQMNESKPTWSDPLTKLSHSVSVPLQQRQSEDKVTAANGDARGGELSKGGEFDPIVGALILSVTLIVMLLWGKVSAILSTAIWFYVVPRFMRPTKIVQIVAHNNGMKNVSSENDLGSLEDKRKVVLQGFLERNN